MSELIDEPTLENTPLSTDEIPEEVSEETKVMDVSQLRDYLIRTTMSTDLIGYKMALYEQRMEKYLSLGGTPQEIVLRMLEMNDI